jgi:hypothetical protein
MILRAGYDNVPPKTLIDGFVNGYIDIPDFQREFIWSDEKVRQFAESMLKGYPIGILIFFNMDNKDNKLYVLDGQQRILSLVLVKNGVITLRNGRSKSINLWLNVIDGSLKVTRDVRSPGLEWVNVSHILKMEKKEMPNLAQKIEKQLVSANKSVNYLDIRENLLKLWETFNGEYYRIPVYVAPSNIGTDELGEIFVRINFAGTRIRAADIYLTMLEISIKEIASKIRVLRSSLESRWPGETWKLDNGTIVKTFLAFITDGKVKIANTVLQQADALKDVLNNKSQTEVDAIWESTKRGIIEAIELLRSQLRITGTTRSWLFISETPLIVMAYYLWKRSFTLSDIEKRALAGWYILAQFFHRYTSAPDTKLNEDLSLAKNNYRTLVDKVWEFAGMKGITEEAFSGKATARGNNLLMMLLVLLQKREAKDFYKINVNIDESQDITIQHIFPVSKLPNSYGEDEVHDIANITFVLSSTNKAIKDAEPEIYLPKVSREILDQHLIPDERLWKIEKYREFLTERRKMLVKEINNYLKFLGVL